MPSNFTENYNLSQWEPGDAVLHTDFNEDNRIIDEALAKKLGQMEVIHMNKSNNGTSSGSGYPADMFNSDVW